LHINSTLLQSNMKNLFLSAFALLFSIFAFAQQNENDRASFIEGSQLMEEFNYVGALPIWLDLLKKDPENANLNYKAGFCYLKLTKERKKSLPFLQKAVSTTTANYDPFAPAEKAAPIEAYFYIGEAYHLNYELDKAIEYYKEFKTLISDKHEFYKKVDLQIAASERAKFAVSNALNVEVKNLGPKVNSEYKEHAPVLSVDESALYFTSRRIREDSSNIYLRDAFDGMYYEDIYVSYKDENDEWGQPELLSINTSDHEATLNLSTDGQTLLIYKTNGLNGDIYESTFDGSDWSTPTPMGSDINTEYVESHAAISPDGQKLYFISNRKGSINFEDKCCDHISSKDIYFCNRLPTGEWALAQPIGNGLNTPWNEDGIFIHPDGKTMYFSSQGHETIGGYDVFYCEMDEEGNWGKPINMGYPINSTDNDVFFVTSADGKRGYYSSLQKDGYGENDIYMISMVGLREKPLTLLIGKIVASDGSTIPNDIQIYVTDNKTKEEVGVYKPRSRDNKFTIIIPPGSDYHLSYETGSGVFFEDDIYVPQEAAYQEINKAIDLRPINFNGKSEGGVEAPKIAPEKTPLPEKIETTSIEKKETTKEVAPAVTKKEVTSTQETVAPPPPPPPPKKKKEVVAQKTETPPAYKTEVEKIDGKKYIIHKVEKGNTLFTISLMYNTSLAVIQAENPWAGDLIYEGDKIKVPIPNNAQFFQEFFEYNVTNINVEAQDFKNFVNEIEKIVKSKDKATISIESSASKVPTSKFGDNESLTAKRATLSKEVLITALKSKGIDASKLYFATMSTLVRGPAYQNDAGANREEYKKYQYIKVIVK
jgi:LysM repeat protein